ncbi:hypothetical protein [Coxiella endosymbiont of Ornithodoros maritimus]|nr:hypothetical protein [Coxiella endosymbiont of Ornithodoros maritimus]
MMEDLNKQQNNKPPETTKAAKVNRLALQIVGGDVPYVGGIFSTITNT